MKPLRRPDERRLHAVVRQLYPNSAAAFSILPNVRFGSSFDSHKRKIPVTDKVSRQTVIGLKQDVEIFPHYEKYLATQIV